MDNTFKIEGFNMPIEIASYSRAKSVKILLKEGYIKITKPKWYSQRKAIKYLEAHKDEVLKLQEKVDNKKKNELGLLETKYMLLYGYKYLFSINLIKEEKASIRIIDNAIIVNISENNTFENIELIARKVLKELYKRKTREIIQRLLIENCSQMRITVPNFRIKDVKTMWGSCSSKGNLNFNLRLAMMPEYVINNIIVHELCHIKYMNHSEKFWNLVYRYTGENVYLAGKKWIKDNAKLINIL